jgi:hypothetical protein
MGTERQRGRRSAASNRNMSTAEREIRKLQTERLELLSEVEDKLTELAERIAHWQKEGVGTAEIGTWLVAPNKPQGVTRQQVYKLVAERVDGKVMRTDKPKAKPRPTRPTRARPTR